MKPTYAVLLIALVAAGCSKGPNAPEALALKYYTNTSDRAWDTTVTIVDGKNLGDYQRQMNNALMFLDSLRIHAPGFIERDSLLTVLYGIHTRQTSPQEFYTTFLKLLLPHQDARTKPTFVPLGDVAEGSDTLHVVSKLVLSGDAPNANRLLVLTLVKNPEGWKVLLPTEMINNSMTRVMQVARLVEKNIIEQNSVRVQKRK